MTIFNNRNLLFSVLFTVSFYVPMASAVISRLFQIYVKDYVECPTCTSPDTKIVKENRISFLICEACGAKSTMKGKYA